MKRKLALIAMSIILGMHSSTMAQSILDVDVNGFEISVTYKNESKFSKATVQMFDDTMTNMIYMGECTPQEKEGVYTAQFEKFNVSSKLPTGTYIIRVGNGSIIDDPKRFEFVNELEMEKAFLAIIGAKSDEELELAIENTKDLPDFGYELYNAYSEDWKEQIREEILNTPWDMDNDTDTLKIEYFNLCDKLYEAIDIMSEQSAAEAAEKIKTAQILGFDTTYFQSKYIADVEYVGEKITTFDFLECYGVDIEELYNQFDGGILTYIIANNDWSTAEAVLKYYDTKGLINVDFESDYNDLSSTKQKKVFDALKNDNITDYTLIADKFEEYADEQADSKSSGSSGGGGNGGFTMGGYTGSVADGAEIVKQETTSAEKDSVFNDLDCVLWAEEAILELNKLGAISGDGRGKFYPSRTITREEFTKIIVMAYDLYDENSEADFNDVSENDWSYKYIASAAEKNIINGMGNGAFNKTGQITREDAAVILYRIYKLNNDDVPAEGSFADGNEISDYAKDAVEAMSSLGAVNGYDRKFHPKKNLTRAEGAKMIYNMLNLK